MERNRPSHMEYNADDESAVPVSAARIGIDICKVLASLCDLLFLETGVEISASGRHVDRSTLQLL